MRNLIIMLPTLDEEHGLDFTLNKIPTDKLHQMGWNYEVWVIDGGSQDDTIKIAMSHNCVVVKQYGKGKGAAMRLGFQKFIDSNADALVMLDPDGTYHPEEIPKLIAQLENHDVIIGDRLNGNLEPDAMTKVNYFGNHLLTWFATGIYGVHIADLCSGFWAFSRNAITRLKLNSMRFEIEAEMFTSCVREELRLKCIPIRYSARIGEAKLGSFTDGWTIFKKLLVRRIFGNPIEARTGKGNLDMEQARNQI